MILLAACGAGSAGRPSYASVAEAPSYEAERAGSLDAMPEGAPMGALASARLEQALPPGAGPSRAAQAAPPPPAGDEAQAPEAIPSRGPILIYTAQLHLAVFEVEEVQARLIAQIGELGGFVAHQRAQELRLRVPAANFQQALRLIEGEGDLLHRDIQAQDVSEQYRDLLIRIQNAEAMRDRLEALLARANTVEDALRIERELQRLTESIEQMKGVQRRLADQVSLSTITIVFRVRAAEPERQPAEVRLPFGWVYDLGLHRLLELGR